MDLAAGQVHVYEPTVEDVPGRDPAGRVPSFDQARHAAGGSRPGTWMAVAFEAPPVAKGRIAAAWRKVIDRHGTLRTVLRQHERSGPGADGSAPLVRVHDIEVTGGQWRRVGDGTSDPRALLRQVFDVACDPFGSPSHRLADVAHPDGSRSIVIGLDHSHTDAWSLLVLVRDMLAFLADEEEDNNGSAALRETVPSFADHIRDLERRPAAPVAVRNRWARIMADGDGDMPVFPLDLGDISEPRDEVVEVLDVLDAAGVARLEKAAEQRGVRLLPLAISVLTAVNRDMDAGTLRAVFPVHSRKGPEHDRALWADSVGWFITNSVLECGSTDTVDCDAAVYDAITLGSHPLEPLLRPWGGMPNTPGMFALSWLDNRRLPVQVPAGTHPQHVSAWIRTDGVMAWFVLNDDGMHLRVRYPGTPEASMNVGGWAQRVADGLREVAGGGTGEGSDDPVLVGEDHDLSPVTQ